MPEPFNPSKAYSCWLKVDYSTLLANIQKSADSAPLIDLHLPFFSSIWNFFEDDLMRAGIKGVISADPCVLTSVNPAFKRILRPASCNVMTGYASEGIIPVLGSFAECLSLSNMAQMLNQRMEFFLKVRSGFSEYAGGDWGLDGICRRLNALPMIDLAGFFLFRWPEIEEQRNLREMLNNSDADNGTVLIERALVKSGLKDLCAFSKWENIGLNKNSIDCLPVEIGFWAFPVYADNDLQIFMTDIGRLNGLSNECPVQIAGKTGKIVKLEANYTEIAISGNFKGPYPTKGYLTGGFSHDPVDFQQWKLDDLKNLLGNMRNCPVYLRKDHSIIEILPT